MKSEAQFRKGCTRTLVMKVLSERPMYGYEIAAALTKRSENIFSLGQGTLYPLLYSLEKKGIIRVCKAKDLIHSVRKRTYYELSPKGQKALEEDISTWKDIMKGMQLVLGRPIATV